MQFTNMYVGEDNFKLHRYWKSAYFIVNNASANFYVTSIYNNALENVSIGIQYDTIDIYEDKLKQDVEFPDI